MFKHLHFLRFLVRFAEENDDANSILLKHIKFYRSGKAAKAISKANKESLLNIQHAGFFFATLHQMIKEIPI